MAYGMWPEIQSQGEITHCQSLTRLKGFNTPNTNNKVSLSILVTKTVHWHVTEIGVLAWNH